MRRTVFCSDKIVVIIWIYMDLCIGMFLTNKGANDSDNNNNTNNNNNNNSNNN
jgi:hypothetical protein